MKRKYWIIGVLIGLMAGLVVGFVMTVLDWRLNPGGIFHTAQGTDWAVVVETAVSWFSPVSIIASAIALLVIFLYVRSR